MGVSAERCTGVAWSGWFGPNSSQQLVHIVHYVYFVRSVHSVHLRPARPYAETVTFLPKLTIFGKARARFYSNVHYKAQELTAYLAQAFVCSRLPRNQDSFRQDR